MRMLQALLLLISLIVASAVSLHAAETFEFLTYTPPVGFALQNTPDGKVYTGKDTSGNGVGFVALLASRPMSRALTEEFLALWQSQIAPALPGPAPESKTGRDGEFTFAVGTKQVSSQGTTMTATLTAFVGRGRVFGVVGVSRGDEMTRAVLGFLGSLALGSASPAAVGGAAPAADIDLEFQAPPGYQVGRDGRHTVMTPVVNDMKTPCLYGISPPRASRGNLEADADAALLDVFPGWQRIYEDRRRSMRGNSETGWPYYWTKADVWQGPSAFAARGVAMAMAIPAGPGSVSIVWGKGSPVCTAEDMSFVRLFFSLRPREWTSDAGKALLRDIQGLWRWSNYSGPNALNQYSFRGDGRYKQDLGSQTQIGFLETTSTSTGDGSFSLRGSELILKPERGGQRVYRIRIYADWNGARWQRVLSLMDETANPVAPIEYFRIDPGAK